MSEAPEQNSRQDERIDVAGMHAPIMREKMEPRDGHEPMPLWMIWACAALLFWGGWYLATYSGGFQGLTLDENPPSRFTASGAPPDAATMGGRLFFSCRSCHQGNGQGIPGAIPPLAGSDWVVGNPARVKRIVLHGLQGPIAVNGETYNSVMPSFASYNDQQLAAVLTFIRTNAAWGNRAEPISPESVAATRAATRNRTKAWTADELNAILADDLPATPPTSRSE